MVEDKLGVEQASAEENEKRFTACLDKSEFITDAGLLADMGMLGEGPAVDDILAGAYSPAQHLDTHTKLVLEFLEMPEAIKTNPMPAPHITVDSHKQGWRKAKETTSSAPQTPDFSHYISASYDNILAEMDATLREIPLIYGFAPDEWNPMADCSIPKKENALRAEKMRTICLMDAQYLSLIHI